MFIRNALHRPPPGVVTSKGWDRALLHRGAVSKLKVLAYSGRMPIKKLVQDSKLRLVTWNIGTLSEKEMELVDTIFRMIIEIAYLQEQSG